MHVATDGLVRAMRDLNVDEARIEAVVTALNGSGEDLDPNKFRTGTHIRPASFGGSPAASELGFHHDKVHQIISDTIDGVTADLQRFAAGAKQAVAYVMEADQQAADDMNRRRAIVDQLHAAASYSEGDERNRRSRHENLGDA